MLYCDSKIKIEVQMIVNLQSISGFALNIILCCSMQTESCSMKSDLHVSAEESVEATHSLWLDLAITGGIEMLPSLFEVFIHELIKSLSGET